jgi:hypothetical protein
MHWPPDPQTRSPAAVGAHFPDDRLGREARRVFDKWARTLTREQKKKLGLLIVGPRSKRSRPYV